jgi:hypothetical protein
MPTLRGPIANGLVALLLMLTAVTGAFAQERAELLLYRVESPGEEPYINRIMVTPTRLRLDQGGQDSGYILYDREQRIIYSVNHEAQSILVIEPPSQPQPLSHRDQPPQIVLRQAGGPVEAPAVAGVKPLQWILSVEGAVCRRAFVLPGLMHRAVSAYSEYLQVMGNQQAVALPSIPVEYQDSCDNAIHVHEPTALLEKGLILKAWDDRGYREELIDFRNRFEVSPSDFTLPDGYHRMPMVSGN